MKPITEQEERSLRTRVRAACGNITGLTRKQLDTHVEAVVKVVLQAWTQREVTRPYR